MTWFKHQGPVGSGVIFERQGEPWSAGDGGGEEDEGRRELQPYQDRVAPEGGSSTVRVTFDTPGDYLLRVRADNFGAHDSTPGDQCCWTNGFVEVSVTP